MIGVSTQPREQYGALIGMIQPFKVRFCPPYNRLIWTVAEKTTCRLRGIFFQWLVVGTSQTLHPEKDDFI